MNTKTNINTKEISTNAIDPVVISRIKFYADTPEGKNKFFCWEIKGVLSFQDALFRFFSKGWYIRAAWYERINQGTNQVIENSRINIEDQYDQYIEGNFSAGADGVYHERQ